MIHHVVAWKLRSDVEKSDGVAQIRHLLVGLDGVVESIRSIEVVGNVAYAEQNSDVAVIATFDDLAGLEAYQTHPEHQAAAAKVRELVVSRSAIDWEA